MTAEWLALSSLFFLPFSKTLGEYGFILAVLAWIAAKLLKKEPLLKADDINLIYGLFLALTLLSLLQIPHASLHLGVRGALKWLKFIAVFLMSRDLFGDEARRRRLTAVFLFSMTLVTLNGYAQMVTGFDLVKHYAIDVPGRFFRMTSSFGSPNGLAAFYLVAIPLAFYSWHKENRWNKKSAVFALLFILFSMGFIFTLSRAAFYSLFISALFYLLLRKNLRAVALICLLLAALFAASPILRSNFIESINKKNEALSERFDLLAITARMIQTSPLKGVGVNMYFTKMPEFATSSETYRGYAHNCFLQMWSEIGLLGMLAFLLPLLLAFWRHSRSILSKAPACGADALFVGLAAFVIHSLGDTHFYALQTAFLFWVFWGAFNAYSKR